MGRWLERLEKGAGAIPPKPPESLSIGFRGVPEGPFPENEETRYTASEWLEWIASEVRLVPEDRTYIWSRLMTLPPGGAEAVARRYVALWKRAADSEPKSHRKENAGRKAANQSLLALVQRASKSGGTDQC